MIWMLGLLHWKCFQTRQYLFGRLRERSLPRILRLLLLPAGCRPLAAAAVLPSAHLVSMHGGTLDHRGFLRTPKERLTRAIGPRLALQRGVCLRT